MRGGGTAAQSAEEAAPGSGQATAPRRTLRQILAELPFIRRVLLSFAAANVFTTAVFVVMPLYTASVLRADGSTVALLEASLGIGTLAGAFTGSRLPGRPTTVGAVCLGSMAVSFALPGMLADRTVYAAAMVVAGWCVGAVGVRFVALFQRLVPPADKPGFFAVMQSLLGATFPLASLLFGVLGDQISPQTLCLIQASGLVPVALVLWRTGAVGNAAEARPDSPGSEVTAVAASHTTATDPATADLAATAATVTAEGGAR